MVNMTPGQVFKKALTENHYDGYWASQIPIVRGLYSARDNARYWQDYYKNTGFKPKYPGRTYSYQTGSVISDAKMLYGSAKKIYG